jgi:DNA primase
VRERANKRLPTARQKKHLGSLLHHARSSPAKLLRTLDSYLSIAVPWVDYAELRRRLDIVDVLAWMKWEAQERNNESLRGRCPFCEATNSPTATSSTKSRSFVVNKVRKLFQCFRCRKGGNVLDLWTLYRKTDTNTAASELLKLSSDHSMPNSSNQQSQPSQPPI